MTDIGEGIWFKLGLDTTGLEQGLNNATNGMRVWRDQTNENTKDMAKWGAAIAATVGPLAAATAATHRLIDEYGGMAKELHDLSLVTDISTESLQKLKYNATISGTDFHTVSASLSRLTLSMQEARDSTSEAGKAFAMLGVSPTGKSPAEVIDETTIALMSMEDTTARNKIAMELYGKSWSELIPYMDSYVKNRDEIRAHVTISEDELQALENAKTGWDKIGDAIYIAGAKATSALLKMQAAANQYNPVAKLLGIVSEQSGWDSGPNPLITPAAADPNKRTIFDTTDYSKDPTSSSNVAAILGMTNPYESGGGGSYSQNAAVDTTPAGVGTYNQLLGELYSSAWISDATKSQYGALPTNTATMAYQAELRRYLSMDPNSPEYNAWVLKRMSSGSGLTIGSNETDQSILAGMMLGGGGVRYTITQQELDAKIKALRATLSTEWARMQRYQAAIGTVNVMAPDPLAAAAAISRMLADQANQGGIT